MEHRQAPLGLPQNTDAPCDGVWMVEPSMPRNGFDHFLARDRRPDLSLEAERRHDN